MAGKPGGEVCGDGVGGFANFDYVTVSDYFPVWRLPIQGTGRMFDEASGYMKLPTAMQAIPHKRGKIE